MAGAALFGFSRLPFDDRLGHLGVHAHYATDILPFVVLMSLGMGLTFVPLTLTAVHGVGARDSGIGSGVLNTMQQVGGALGLATLSTVAVHFTQDKGGRHRRGRAGGGAMIRLGTIIAVFLLNARHEDLATDEVPEGIGV